MLVIRIVLGFTLHLCIIELIIVIAVICTCLNSVIKYQASIIRNAVLVYMKRLHVSDLTSHISIFLFFFGTGMETITEIHPRGRQRPVPPFINMD